jgi:hypothetical protein
MDRPSAIAPGDELQALSFWLGARDRQQGLREQASTRAQVVCRRCTVTVRFCEDGTCVVIVARDSPQAGPLLLGNLRMRFSVDSVPSHVSQSAASPDRWVNASRPQPGIGAVRIRPERFRASAYRDSSHSLMDCGETSAGAAQFGIPLDGAACRVHDALVCPWRAHATLPRKLVSRPSGNRRRPCGHARPRGSRATCASSARRV